MKQSFKDILVMLSLQRLHFHLVIVHICMAWNHFCQIAQRMNDGCRRGSFQNTYRYADDMSYDVGKFG